jgi:ABC-type transporter Mla subunit MlaD
MRRRRSRYRVPLADQPVLLGAVAILVSIAAIYIVYNAAAGLPFAPKYEVEAVIPDAESLGKVGDVRLAGVLVGQVHDRHIRNEADGTTSAVLELALDPSLEPLPEGTTMRMRANSALGGSYVELLPGSSRRPMRGDPPTIDASRAPHTISITDALAAYDARTRRAAGRTLTGYGDALTGRGADLNGFIAVLPELMTNLDGAARVLAAPSSDLAGFIDGFARLNEEVAPAAEAQAGFFSALDRTFGALEPVREDVAQSSVDAPPMLDAGIEGFPAQRELIRETAGLFAALRPGVRAARVAADDIAGAALGTPPAFTSVRSLAPRLSATGRAVTRFATAPGVVASLKTLRATFAALAPTASDLRAAQVVCNYPSVLLRNLLSTVEDGTPVGNWLSAVTVLNLPGQNGEAGPSSAPAAGPARENYLHATITPAVGQAPSRECESGNEKYVVGEVVVGGAPGRQPARTDATTPAGGAR